MTIRALGPFGFGVWEFHIMDPLLLGFEVPGVLQAFASMCFHSSMWFNYHRCTSTPHIQSKLLARRRDDIMQVADCRGPDVAMYSACWRKRKFGWFVSAKGSFV